MLLLPALLVLAHIDKLRRDRTKMTWIALVVPPILLFFGLIYPWLWLRFHAMNLLAIVLLFWMWGIAGEISELPQGGAISETAIP